MAEVEGFAARAVCEPAGGAASIKAGGPSPLIGIFIKSSVSANVSYLLPAFAGLLGGVLGPVIGVGGGVVIVPIVNLAGWSFREAVAASLFSIVVTSLVSVLSRRAVSLKYIKYAALPAAAAVLASVVNVKYGGPLVERAYGVYLLAIAALMYFSPQAKRTRPAAGSLLMFLGGFASSLFGIGGGTIYVPALTMLMGLTPKDAAAVSMALILPTTVAGATAYAAQGALNLGLALAVAAGSALGSYLTNRYVVKRASSSAVRSAFVAYSLAVGLYYLLK